MKHIVIALSGASDASSPELGEKTPYDLAKIPTLHHFAKIGKVGQACFAPSKVNVSPETTLLSALGYAPDDVYTGLGPIEAANLDLQLEENEVAFRMNFITESAGLLADSTAGNISTKEAKALINFLNKKVASDFVRFFPGSGYRHIAIIKDAHGYDALSARTADPTTLEGQKMDDLFPKGPGDELLKKMMFDAKLLLQDHEVNQVRVDLGENPANMIWLWGQGPKPRLEKLSETFGFSGALVTSREYAAGIGKLAGLSVMDLPAPEVGEEIDYKGIADFALEAIKENDFVCLHLDACDEASMNGNSKAKISALEGIDFFILSKIRRYMEDNMESRIFITPCHQAPWKLRARTRESVPFVMAGKNIMADDVEQFSEDSAEASDLKVKNGHEVLSLFLAK